MFVNGTQPETNVCDREAQSTVHILGWKQSDQLLQLLAIRVYRRVYYGQTKISPTLHFPPVRQYQPMDPFPP